MNVLNFLYTVDCSTGAGGIGPIISLAANFVHLLQWVIPIALILFGMIDLGKAVIAGKEDEMKKAQGTLIKRFIYAVLIFFVITLVGFIMGLVGDSGVDVDDAGGDNVSEMSWNKCWNMYW